MALKNQIKKVAVAGLATGALVLAGLGTIGTASADEDNYQMPNADGTPSYGQLQQLHAAQQYAASVVLRANYVLQQQYAYSAPVYYTSPVYPYYSYNYTAYNYLNGVALYGTFGLITNSAEVLNLPESYVISQLTLGKSLSQIAVERGWQRDTFLAAVIRNVQADIVYASGTGAVNPAYASSMMNAIAGRAGVLIDQAGLR